MRLHLATMIAALLVAGTAMAQSPGGSSVPREIGNRANGFDYQPTPGEVGPREKSAGVQLPAAQRNATDQELEQMDKNLLREQGLSTKSVPNMATGQ